MVLKDLESGFIRETSREGKLEDGNYRSPIFILGIITEMLEAFYNDEFHRFNIEELWKYLSFIIKIFNILFS